VRDDTGRSRLAGVQDREWHSESPEELRRASGSPRETRCLVVADDHDERLRVPLEQPLHVVGDRPCGGAEPAGQSAPLR
jgi:hypothetical protein